MTDLAACPIWPGVANSKEITRWCVACETETNETVCFLCHEPTSTEPPPLWFWHGQTETWARAAERARESGYTP